MFKTGTGKIWIDGPVVVDVKADGPFMCMAKVDKHEDMIGPFNHDDRRITFTRQEGFELRVKCAKLVHWTCAAIPIQGDKETIDSRPVEGFVEEIANTPTLKEEMQRFIADMREPHQETFEEANDFDIPDDGDDYMFTSYEIVEMAEEMLDEQAANTAYGRDQSIGAEDQDDREVTGATGGEGPENGSEEGEVPEQATG